VTPGRDPTSSLQRFADIGACPTCRGDVKLVLEDVTQVRCVQCGSTLREESGVISALPSGHPVSQRLSQDRSSRAGWATGIAVHMDLKSSSYSRKYDEYSLTSRGFIIRRDLAIDLAGPHPGRVLEAGCGPGVVGPSLRDLGADVHGVDLSSEQLRLAAGRDARGVYVQANLERLPYRDSVFDTIIMLGVFEYLESPEAVLREMARVGRQRSRLIISVPNAWSPARIWTHYAYTPAVRAWRRVRGTPLPSYSRTLYAAGRFQDLLEETGILVDTVRYFDVVIASPPFHKVLPPRAVQVSDALERRLEGWARVAMTGQFMARATIGP
jgi:ubiquinone/menaquinone biosynthesis C-methylase UbiE